MSQDKQSSNSSIQRVLKILEVVANTAHTITATEINRHLDLPKPTIHRLCSQLEAEGFLQSSLDGRGFSAGSKMTNMAISILSNNDFQRAHRHRILERLSGRLGETCNIAVLDGDRSIYFDRVETHWPLRIQLQVNDRVPLHCTASGKLFLSELTSIQRSRLLAKLSLEKHTENSLVTPESLKPALTSIKKSQIGIDNEEFLKGMIAIAVPIRDKQNRMFAALAMHAPTARMNLQTALTHAELMNAAASEIAALMEDSTP